MNLRDFLRGLPSGAGKAFAERCGIKPYSYLLSFANGSRTPSEIRCVVIERESNYQVRRWDLRPKDWHLIWPELIGAKGAPAPQSKSPERETA